MRELSLFSGAGGGLAGTVHLLGWRPVGYVEIDDYCQRVLRRRIDDGYLPAAPIFSDIRAFLRDGYAESYQGLVDVVTAGFPCQPFSVAGRGEADRDDRNLWPETIAVLRVVRPRFALLENVPGLLSGSHGYFGRVLGELAEAGFDAEWGVLGAVDAGAPHQRKRVWIAAAAHTEREPVREQHRGGGRAGRKEAPEPGDLGPAGLMADTDGEREQQPAWCLGEGGRWAGNGGAWWRADPADIPDSDELGLAGLQRPGVPRSPGGLSQSCGCGAPGELADAECPERRPKGEDGCGLERKDPIRPRDGEENSGWPRTGGCSSGWPAESRVGRVAHGVAHRVDRLTAVGNGQVPAVVALAWHLLGGAER